MFVVFCLPIGPYTKEDTNSKAKGLIHRLTVKQQPIDTRAPTAIKNTNTALKLHIIALLHKI